MQTIISNLKQDCLTNIEEWKQSSIFINMNYVFVAKAKNVSLTGGVGGNSCLKGGHSVKSHCIIYHKCYNGLVIWISLSGEHTQPVVEYKSE